MVFIYILQLQNGKYYVGKTSNPSFRLEQHFNADGSNWTKKYKPIKVIDIIPGCDDYDEDKYTIQFMEKYGINSVRGGSFCEIKLSDTNISTLNQMIRGITDKCYICGRNDHFANDCKKFIIQKNPMNEKCDCPSSYLFPHRRKKCSLNKLISLFEDENDDIDKLIKIEEPKNKNNGPCYRCGRNSHYIKSCYASTHINGNSLK
jgi:hypothetical protein